VPEVSAGRGLRGGGVRGGLSTVERSPVLVAAGVIIEEGRVLLAQRKRGTHLAGAWEFPGGKVEAGEDPRSALERELREELGIDAAAGEIVEVTYHRYPEKDVLLLFFEAVRRPWSAEPRPLDVASVKWAPPAGLADKLFPPADVAVLAKVRARLRRGERTGP
jgi:8-oxo-dGTP diphosphatase